MFEVMAAHPGCPVAMVAPEHAQLRLHHFSTSHWEARFQPANTQKPITELTFADLLVCLQRRQYLDPVIELVLDHVATHWAQIDRYYVDEIGAWWEEVIKAVLTIPYTFWDNKHSTFHTLRDYVTRTTKWELQIEPQVLAAFLAHRPQELMWTLQDEAAFRDDLCLGWEREFLGNLLLAEDRVRRLKVGFLHGQRVWIESAWHNIATEAALMAYLLETFPEYAEAIAQFQETIAQETRIRFVAGTG